MKVNNFKVREIDGEVAKILTDKQAGINTRHPGGVPD